MILLQRTEGKGEGEEEEEEEVEVGEARVEEPLGAEELPEHPLQGRKRRDWKPSKGIGLK